MSFERNVLLSLSRDELGLVTDALDLMEDAEHLRPWRQDLIAALSARIEQLTGLYDFAAWENDGHSAPDFLWTIVLILAIIVMLRFLRVL